MLIINSPYSKWKIEDLLNFQTDDVIYALSRLPQQSDLLGPICWLQQLQHNHHLPKVQTFDFLDKTA